MFSGGRSVAGADIIFGSGIQYQEVLCCIRKTYAPVSTLSLIRFQLLSYHSISQDLSGEKITLPVMGLPQTILGTR